jgi:ADP-ribosyl-[dinitrogen reductase] hydrolase
MELSDLQRDRASGVLLGQAIGDALGVPYEFGSAPLNGPAQMIGGGLGPYRPGEWSDDTQMAICIAQVGAIRRDLTSTPSLDAIAAQFVNWRHHGASDIGTGTRWVLDAALSGEGRLSQRMLRASQAYAEGGRGAGNGALMRTGIVGLTNLSDRDATAAAAKAIAALTHADQRCQDSAVLWSEAVRVAVIDGVLDLRSGLDLLGEDQQAFWAAAIDEAERNDPSRFRPNGFTVTALQAAWSAIWATKDAGPGAHFGAAVQRAIQIGDDTDTVAAIAGALLGAQSGASVLLAEWVERVHGWPGGIGSDALIELALATAGG